MPAATTTLRRAFWALAHSFYLMLTWSALLCAWAVYAVATQRPTLDAALLPAVMILSGLWAHWLSKRL